MPTSTSIWDQSGIQRPSQVASPDSRVGAFVPTAVAIWHNRMMDATSGNSPMEKTRISKSTTVSECNVIAHHHIQRCFLSIFKIPSSGNGNRSRIRFMKTSMLACEM
jgi:hypothetical protein